MDCSYFTKILESEKKTEIELDKLFDMIDMNNDGQIEWFELAVFFLNFA